MALRVRNWEISTVVMESFMSCLLAKIRMEAPRRACGQRSADPVSQPGPSLPFQCPMSAPPSAPLLSLQGKPIPRWNGDGGDPSTLATPENDTNSLWWNAFQSVYINLTTVP